MENKNYNQIKDNKYFFAENRFMEILKHSDNGYILKDENGEKCYLLEYGWQGYYYKDKDAFYDKKGICYIPEYCNSEDPFMEYDGTLVYSNKNLDNCYSRKDIDELVELLLKGDEYNWCFKNEIPSDLISLISENVFNVIDWQHPSSYLAETDWTLFIEDYFLEHDDSKNLYGSNEIIEKLYKKETDELEYIRG